MVNHIIIVTAFLVFFVHTYALRIILRKDRRRPAVDSARLVSHPWAFSLATILAASMLEWSGDKYQVEAAHAWQWAAIVSLVGIAFAVSILAGRRGN